MTEDPGLEPVVPVTAPEPAEDAAPEPEPESEPAPEPESEAEVPAPAGPPQPREEPPDPVLPPFIPDQGVPEWLRDVVHELHRRLRNLERA